MQLLDFIPGWKYGIYRRNADRITIATDCSKIS